MLRNLDCSKTVYFPRLQKRQILTSLVSFKIGMDQFAQLSLSLFFHIFSCHKNGCFRKKTRRKREWFLKPILGDFRKQFLMVRFKVNSGKVFKKIVENLCPAKFRMEIPYSDIRFTVKKIKRDNSLFLSLFSHFIFGWSFRRHTG